VGGAAARRSYDLLLRPGRRSTALLATTPGAYQERLLAAVTDPEASFDVQGDPEARAGEIMVDMYGDNARVGKGKTPRVYLVSVAGEWEEEQSEKQSGGAVLVKLLQPLVRVCSDVLQYYTANNDPDFLPVASHGGSPSSTSVRVPRGGEGMGGGHFRPALWDIAILIRETPTL